MIQSVLADAVIFEFARFFVDLFKLSVVPRADNTKTDGIDGGTSGEGVCYAVELVPTIFYIKCVLLEFKCPTSEPFGL